MDLQRTAHELMAGTEFVIQIFFKLNGSMQKCTANDPDINMLQSRYVVIGVRKAKTIWTHYAQSI